MSKALRVSDYLDYIRQAIDRIGRYTAGLDEEAFMKSEMVQDAIVRNIEIIGEAAHDMLRDAPAFAARHQEIPWKVLYGMRNKISHGYHIVDLGLVWQTAIESVPQLAPEVQKAQMAALQEESQPLSNY